MRGLTPKEIKIFKKLTTAEKIQDFLDTLPINYEKKGETHMSPRRVLRENKAHCVEGALLAAAALWFHGRDPLIFELTSVVGDDDHVLALYKTRGLWGAISKTNHATLRFRDPVYKTIRELALSYFHEYFVNETGKKTLRSYSKPLNLKKLGFSWITSEEDLWHIDRVLDKTPHIDLFPKGQEKILRPADSMEKKAGRLLEWSKKNPKT